MSTHQRYKGIRTGDVLLFTGSNIAQVGLKLAMGSEYIHVGIAVWLKTEEGNRLHSLEAGTFREHCAITNNRKSGARLVDIDLIMGHHTCVAYRPVKVVRDKEFYNKLKNFMKTWSVRRYCRPLRMISLQAGWRKDAGNKEVFCSELCAAWLYECGCIPYSLYNIHPPHSATPQTFAGLSTISTTLFGGEDIRIIHKTEEHDIHRNKASGLLLCTLLILFVLIMVVALVEKQRR